MKGGTAIGTPISPVYASNITPDKQIGIDNWNLAQFSDAVRCGAVRCGCGPSGHLYPAMPYTSYTAMSDDDVRALYSYLMLDVKPDPTLAPETSLEFPFVRPAMIVWNMLFFSPGRVRGAATVEGAQLSRGKELVETFGHCSSCHTPRGNMMEEDTSRHLAGGRRTSRPTRQGSGIGAATNWSSFCALVIMIAGDMGLAISRSLSRLTPDDTEAMAAYLKAVPTTAGQVSASADAPATPVTNPALIRTARPRMARCFTRTPARVVTASLARAAWIGALRRWPRSAAC